MLTDEDVDALDFEGVCEAISSVLARHGYPKSQLAETKVSVMLPLVLKCLLKLEHKECRCAR